MSTFTEQVTRCDKCGNPPSQDYGTTHLSCGHDICDRHKISDGFGKLTCPICKKVNYGRSDS